MKSARLYHNSIQEYGFINAKRIASDEHNLRADSKNKNVVHSETQNNLLSVLGQKVDPTQGEDHLKRVTAICDALKTDFQREANKNDQNTTLSNQRKAELIQDRILLKQKIKKWSENEKAELNEIQFWKDLQKKIGLEALNGKELAAELQSFGKSVKRFNDKKRVLIGGKYKDKAVNSIDELNDLIGTKSRNINSSVITKELVYKIPDKHNVEIEAKHWVRLSRAIQRQYYSDFDSIYEAVHCDEENSHIHVRLSGQNKKTGAFDIQNQMLNNVRRLDKQNRISDKKYSELNENELKILGEVYQEQVFSMMNQFLKKLDYDVKVKKRTKEEIEKDNHNYSDKHKKSAEREFNYQNKKSIENNKLDLEAEKKQEIIDLQDLALDEQILDIQANNETISDQESFMKRLTDSVKSRKDDVVNYFNNLWLFAEKNNITAKNDAVDFHNEIDEQDKEMSEMLNKSINKELSKEKKQEYSETKKERKASRNKLK